MTTNLTSSFIAVSGQIADSTITLPKLANGTANKLIGFNGAGVPAEVAAGAMSLVQAQTLSSAVADITFSSLDINNDGMYFLFFEVATSATGEVSLQIDGDTTTTNYYSQWRTEGASTIGTSRANSPSFTNVNSATATAGWGTIQLTTDGYSICYMNSHYQTGVNIQTNQAVISSKNGANANITSVTLHNLAGNFSIGSKAALYKVVRA